MKYTKMRLTDFPRFYEHYIKNPKPLLLNLTPPDDGMKIFARPESMDMNGVELPEDFHLVETHHAGGVILVFPEGVTLFAFLPKDAPCPQWRENLVELCRRRGLDAQSTGNDVMVNGRKVCGYMSRDFGKLRFYGTHISIRAEVETIERLCPKRMEKIPAGLSRFGIMRTDVLQALEVE